MILIMSQAQFDHSTEAVMDWLDALGGHYTRINGARLLETEPWHLQLGGSQGTLVNGLPQPGQVSTVWFRRWNKGSLVNYNNHLDAATGERLQKHLAREFGKLSSFIFSLYQQAYWLTDYRTVDINKLTALQVAQQVGFSVPPTIITNNKATLHEFVKQYGRAITKPIADTELFQAADGQSTGMLTIYTEEVNEASLAAMPDTFFPSLCQHRIDKVLEYRVFYLEGAIYPMAIFSQASKQTATDFRKYVEERPNRRSIPILGQEVEQKIHALMQALNLNTGSIDFILSKTGQLTFLEVNPVGQFAALSENCNYQLEKKIAEFLIKKDHEQQQPAT